MLYFGFYVKYSATSDQSMPNTYDMMMNLKEIFGDQTRSARKKAMKDLMNTTMAETTLVRDHVLKMISLLN